MSASILLSFVVPVYNVEKYLRECLDSLFDPSADEDEYEVIAVDDGSTDNSPEILKTYAHHKNFRIITQKNAGLGPARNTGINAAKGRYISFIDSDDYLLPGAVPTLLGWARESDCDMIEFEIESSNESLQKLDQIKPRTERTPASGDGKTLFVEWQRQGAYLPSACIRIYKKVFLDAKSLRFLPLIHEDAEWQPRCFFYADEVNYHPVLLYHYRLRDGSIMRSPSEGTKRCRDLINLLTAYSAFRNTIEPNGENADFLKELGAMAAPILERAINIAFKTVPQKGRGALFNEMKKLRDVLALSASKKGRRMYQLTRWLPAEIAFRMYKIF